MNPKRKTKKLISQTTLNPNPHKNMINAEMKKRRDKKEYYMDILRVCVINLRKLEYNNHPMINMPQIKEILKGSKNSESSFGILNHKSDLLEMISEKTINDYSIFMDNLLKIPFEKMLKNKSNQKEIIKLLRSLSPEIINMLLIKEIVDLNYKFNKNHQNKNNIKETIEMDLLDELEVYDNGKIRYWDIYGSNIFKLPELIGVINIEDQEDSLRSCGLSIDSTNIQSLPECIRYMEIKGSKNAGLKIINNINLKSIPESFSSIKVGPLDLSKNDIKVLPESFSSIKVNGNLLLNGNKIKRYPESFFNIEVNGHLHLDKLFPNVTGLLNEHE